MPLVGYTRPMEIQKPPTAAKDKNGTQKTVNNPNGVTAGNRPAFAEKSYLERAREAYEKLLQSQSRKE